MIGASLLDDGWLDEVRDRVGDKPTLFTAEGLFYFFTEAQIRGVVKRIADQFPSAGLVFDAQSKLFLALSNLRAPHERLFLDVLARQSSACGGVGRAAPPP